MAEDEYEAHHHDDAEPATVDGDVGLEVSTPRTPSVPFADLVAPTPLSAEPPESARWLAFAGILIGGLLGGLIGYGTGDLMGQSSLWAAVGALVGGVIGAVGVGIVASLTLRAMNEWKAVDHPEGEHHVR